jgi:hypothetical protein
MTPTGPSKRRKRSATEYVSTGDPQVSDDVTEDVGVSIHAPHAGGNVHGDVFPIVADIGDFPPGVTLTVRLWIVMDGANIASDPVDVVTR